MRGRTMRGRSTLGRNIWGRCKNILIRCLHNKPVSANLPQNLFQSIGRCPRKREGQHTIRIRLGLLELTLRNWSLRDLGQRNLMLCNWGLCNWGWRNGERRNVMLCSWGLCNWRLRNWGWRNGERQRLRGGGLSQRNHRKRLRLRNENIGSPEHSD